MLHTFTSFLSAFYGFSQGLYLAILLLALIDTAIHRWGNIEPQPSELDSYLLSDSLCNLDLYRSLYSKVVVDVESEEVGSENPQPSSSGNVENQDDDWDIDILDFEGDDDELSMLQRFNNAFIAPQQPQEGQLSLVFRGLTLMIEEDYLEDQLRAIAEGVVSNCQTMNRTALFHTLRKMQLV